jgi:hypothetical protein
VQGNLMDTIPAAAVDGALSQPTMSSAHLDDLALDRRRLRLPCSPHFTPPRKRRKEKKHRHRLEKEEVEEAGEVLAEETYR